MKAQILISVFTALGASLCCITPVFGMVAGVSGLASTFAWVEPFRPYLISSTVFVLGFAWFKAFKSEPVDDCGCTEKVSFFQTKKFLSLISVLSLLLITFPS